jgi:cobalamin synthase
VLFPDLSAITDFAVRWALLLFFTIEILVMIYLNPKHHLSTIEDSDERDKMTNRATQQRGRALAIASITFAGVAVIVSSPNQPEGIGAVLNVFGIAFSFLLVSFMSKTLIQTKRVWSLIQETTLEYGALYLFLSIVLLYHTYVSFPIILIGGFVIAFALRIYAVRKEAEAYYKMPSGTEE